MQEGIGREVASWHGLARFAVTTAIGVASSAALALPFTIRPIDFGEGIVATGTISTAGNSPIIDDWSLKVTTTTQLAHFTPANTRSKVVSMVQVSADGRALTVATSPDSAGGMDGGVLGFRAPNPSLDLGAFLADFNGANAVGGQASYMAGGAFDYRPLGQPDNADYLVATLSPNQTNVFDLVPLAFDNGVTLRGTVKTDGSTGAIGLADIIDWDIMVDQMTVDVFDKTNSTLQANLVGLSPDRETLTLDNPDGFLAFGKAAVGGRLHALQLADFTSGSYFYNQAGYFLGRQGFYTANLRAPLGPWAISGDAPIFSVPEPPAIRLVLLMLGIMLAVRVSRHRASRSRALIV
jgi:hypothetical protein